MENAKFQDLVLEHLARLTQEITVIKEEMTGFKNEISGIKNEMTGFQNEISGIKNEISEFKNEISGIKNEISGIKNEISGIKNEISGIKNEISGIKNEISEFKKETQENFAKIETRIENEIIDKIRSLYDAREVQSDVNERIISTLGRLETKMDVLQLETASIRRVKNKTAK